jgi:hypothetical protein
MVNGKKIFIALLAMMLALASFALRARAQEGAEAGVFRSDDLEMTVSAGFGKLRVSVRDGGWAPFRISLANNGRPITGRLIVRTESNPNPSFQVREFVKNIQLPTNSRQIHEISAFINSSHKPPEIILESDGDQIAQTTVPVEPNFMGNQIEIAIIDTEQTTLNNIDYIARAGGRIPFKPAPPKTEADETLQPPPPQQGPRQGQFPNSRQGPPARHVVIPAEDLPRDFASYDSLDVVILGDAPMSRLTEDQARALRLWVASGGMLILTGGTDFGGLRAAGLDALLPVEVRGAATTAALAELTDTYGQFESPDPTLIQSASERKGARTLLGASDRVIVGERDYGSGIVRFLAINPKINPYRGWGAATVLWGDLLLPALVALPGQAYWFRGNSRYVNSGIQNYLFDLAEIKPLSANYFLLFLLAYILAVGPINYVALRLTKKLDLAWITIPGVVLLFTGVSLTVAEMSRGGGTVAADVTLVELNQRDGISRSVGSLLIMPSSKGTQRITFDGENTFAIDTAGNSDSRPASSEQIEVERTPEGSALSVPMNTWTSGAFNILSMDETPSPMISIMDPPDPKAATPQVRIKNVSNTPVASAVYVSAEGLSDLFDLAAGEEKTIALNPPQPTTFSSWFRAKLVQGSAEDMIFDQIAHVLDREVGGQKALRQGFFNTAQMPDAVKLLERPLMLGFAEGTPIQMSLQNSPRRRSKSFYVIHL